MTADDLSCPRCRDAVEQVTSNTEATSQAGQDVFCCPGRALAFSVPHGSIAFHKKPERREGLGDLEQLEVAVTALSLILVTRVAEVEGLRTRLEETGHLRPDLARRLDSIEQALWDIDQCAVELVRFARVIAPERFDDEARNEEL